jgi:hypothetical protein
MTLPAHPNAISMAQLRRYIKQTTTGAINMGQLYSGGPFTAAGSRGIPGGVLTNIPVSGTIRMGNFHQAMRQEQTNYLTPGSYTYTGIPDAITSVDILLVGGGGAGGSVSGSQAARGGGGGGQVIRNSLFTVQPNGSVSVTVGSGGIPSTSTPTAGTQSSAQASGSSVTTVANGGLPSLNTSNGGNSGSGFGGGVSPTQNAAGGGGGQTDVGQPGDYEPAGNSLGGNGGAGISQTLAGTLYAVGGGGGGGARLAEAFEVFPGQASDGGGGGGATTDGPAQGTSGTANTGGGGGGAASDIIATSFGGAGGSGVVRIYAYRYYQDPFF